MGFVSPTAANASPPHAEALFTKQPPIVDGIIGQQEWARAVPFHFPVPPGSSAAQPYPGEIRALWMKEGLYLAFRGIETTPIFGHEPAGEPVYAEDVFEVFVDQIGDHRQYYEIQIDPAGQLYFKNYVLTAPPVLTDEMRMPDEFVHSEVWRYTIPKPDGFQCASRIDPQTHLWTLEAFLPASFVNRRHGGGSLEPGTWRMNFARYDWDRALDQPGRDAQFFYWAPVVKGNPHNSPTIMGYLKLEK